MRSSADLPAARQAPTMRPPEPTPPRSLGTARARGSSGSVCRRRRHHCPERRHPARRGAPALYALRCRAASAERHRGRLAIRTESPPDPAARRRAAHRCLRVQVNGVGRRARLCPHRQTHCRRQRRNCQCRRCRLHKCHRRLHAAAASAAAAARQPPPAADPRRFRAVCPSHHRRAAVHPPRRCPSPVERQHRRRHHGPHHVARDRRRLRHPRCAAAATLDFRLCHLHRDLALHLRSCRRPCRPAVVCPRLRPAAAARPRRRRAAQTPARRPCLRRRAGV
mmetsp:Transcript_24483/g.72572  ORF Transcript_24483/g.72572 Transcript_24483/m.72572 type:complete len:280 (-) Transcript_24483:2-841(-)